MTHDELVRFAAGKVGGTIVGDSISLGGLDACGQLLLHDLTSPELFLKGLEAARKENFRVIIYHEEIYMKHNECTGCGHFVDFENPSDIPLTFWLCWAQLSEEAANEE